MQAIITKYLGATDKRPSRLKATCQAGNITMSYSSIENELEMMCRGNNVEDCHHYIAELLADKLGWLDDCRIVSGSTEKFYVHVLVRLGEQCDE